MKTKRGITLREFLDEELKDPEIRAHYEEAAAEWQVAREVAVSRRRARLTQRQLARRIRSSQQAVSRIEAGEQNAGVRLLQKIAKAVGGRLQIRIVPL